MSHGGRDRKGKALYISITGRFPGPTIPCTFPGVYRLPLEPLWSLPGMTGSEGHFAMVTLTCHSNASHRQKKVCKGEGKRGGVSGTCSLALLSEMLVSWSCCLSSYSTWLFHNGWYLIRISTYTPPPFLVHLSALMPNSLDSFHGI